MPVHNLPVQRDPLIGREPDVQAVRHLLMREDVGLVTLVGAGGTGKTRVALKVGADLLADFEDGVFFVPLASIADPSLVTSAIAQVLDIRDAGTRPLLDTLTEHLRDRRCLLIVDNVEHLLAAAPVLADLLAAGPHLKILVTSRAVLRLHGEHVLQVPPLALPDPAALAGRDVERIRACPAVALFLRRVAAADPALRLSDDDVVAAGAICARLDGLPLAIELAAARVRLLPPRVMRERLERRLPLLTAGPRDVPARQRTLRDAITWSYDLLTPEEQCLFRYLAIFPGGSTVALFQAIFVNCDDESVLMDHLQSLVDKSLVARHDDGDSEPRFTMLETIREYALERLSERAETDTLRRRHAAVFLCLVEQASRKLTTPERGPWIVRLEAELDNVRAALAWSQAVPDGGDVMLRIAGALVWFWFWRGHLGEGLRWVEAALAQGTTEPTLARARSLYGVGLISFFLGDYRPMGTNLEASIAILRMLGSTRDLAYALTTLGIAWNRAGTLEVARRAHAEARAHFRLVGDRWGLAFASTNEGDVHAVLGDHAAANAALDESAGIAQALDDGWLLAHSHLSRALMEFRSDNLPRSAFWYSQSLAALRHGGDPWFVARSLQGLASVLWRRDEPAGAATLFGAAEALLDTIGVPTHAALRPEHDRDELAARASRDEPAIEIAWQDGRSMSPQDAIACAEGYAAALAPGTAAPPADGPDDRTSAPLTRASGHELGADPLTPREREVAALVARGYSNRQIADALVIGVRTAENHVAHICARLRLNSRAQIAAWAARRGLLPDESVSSPAQTPVSE